MSAIAMQVPCMRHAHAFNKTVFTPGNFILPQRSNFETGCAMLIAHPWRRGGNGWRASINIRLYYNIVGQLSCPKRLPL
jgi:hypothetical protein